MISPKELKKLAAECRKAGIKSFKCADFEFTLTDEIPVSTYKKKESAKAPLTSLSEEFQTDSLTQDQLLLWSTGGPLDESVS